MTILQFEDGKSYSVREIIKTHKHYTKQAKELEAALKELRGNGRNGDWEVGIDQDDRYSVKLLYGQLLDLIKTINNLESTVFTLPRPVPTKKEMNPPTVQKGGDTWGNMEDF